MFHTMVFRVGAVAAVLGAVIAVVFNALYPRSDDLSALGVADLALAGGRWQLVHYMISWAIVLLLIGLMAVAHSFTNRVIRPGGQLRFLEHVAADGRAMRLVQRIADASVWPMPTGGCRTARDPLHAIVQAGFYVQTVRRLRFPESKLPVPSAPHLLGTVQRP